MGLSNLLTVKEVAAYLKTSRQQVRKMIQSGTLYAVQVGREYRIPFEVSADPFYSESNLQHLESVMQDVKAGKARFAEHDLIEVD